MSELTLKELTDAVARAAAINDIEALIRYADELEKWGTKQADVYALAARGWVEQLRGNYPAAIEYYNHVRVLYEEMGNELGVAFVNSRLGVTYNSTGNHAAALECFQRAQTHYEELGDRQRLAVVAHNTGMVYYNTGNLSAALELYHRALAVYEERGDRPLVAAVSANIGNVHAGSGNYPAALEYYRRAYAINDEIGNRFWLAVVTNNIGMVYQATGNYPEALEQYYAAMALYEELENPSGVALVISNIGVVHANTGNHQAALEHHHRALEMQEALGENSRAAETTRRIGNAYHATGNYPAALAHLRRALEKMEELGERGAVANTTGNILSALVSSGDQAEAQALLQKMDAMQIDSPGVVIGRETNRARLQEKSGNTDDAKATLVAALEIAREHSLSAYQADVHKALRDLALQSNDLASYVEHNNEFTRITEEINGKEATLRMAMQEKQREIAEREKETAKHLAVLHSTLPKHIADRVARGEAVNDHYDNAAVIFLDIVGFTTISDHLTSEQVVRLLEQVFTTLDAVCEKYDVVKVKTIGDSYMAVAFPRFARNDNSLASSLGEVRDVVERAANAALDMLDAVSKPITEYLPDIHEVLLEDQRVTLPEGIRVRIGMHVGAVTAGVIGTTRMQYDVWGDTVNVASRMESTGEPGMIHVSEQFASILSADPMAKPEERGTWHVAHRGETEVKGKGTMTTYWLDRHTSADELPPTT